MYIHVCTHARGKYTDEHNLVWGETTGKRILPWVLSSHADTLMALCKPSWDPFLVPIGSLPGDMVLTEIGWTVFYSLARPFLTLRICSTYQISVASSWAASQSLTMCSLCCCCCHEKARKILILLNASKGLCLAPVLIKGEIYWSLCLRRKSGFYYQIVHQRQVLM